MCDSVDGLKTSISTLASPSTLTGGKSGIQSTLDDVKTSLDDLESTVKSSDKPQVTALKNSVDDLQQSVSDLSGSGLSGLGRGHDCRGGKVATSAGDLVDTLKAGCPAS